jgi:hypothetical protein
MRKRRLARVTAVVVALVLGSMFLAGPASATQTHHRVTLLSARLSGAQEVPGPGDPDGRGHVVMTLDARTGTICYLLTVRRIDPATAAHIHIGPAGVAGPVVQALEAPTSGASFACVSNPMLVAEIMAKPADYYVNVHNAPFPAGAVRGQLG